MAVVLQVDWKPARITDLVKHLCDLVRMQYNEVRRALCGLGDFQLAVPLTQMRWNGMTEEAKTRAVAKLTADNGVRRPVQRTVTSTDGQVTVTGSPRIARKKGQLRQPVSERSRSKV